MQRNSWAYPHVQPMFFSTRGREQATRNVLAIKADSLVELVDQTQVNQSFKSNFSTLRNIR